MENHEGRPNGAQGEIAARKAALRKRLRAERAALAPDERATADARIAEQLFALPAWREAHVVFAYLSFGSEVDTRRVIERAWAEGKTVALPRCVVDQADRAMTWHRVTSFNGLVRSSLGVDEPPASPATRVDPAAPDPAHAVALVPGLAFDAQGYRIGYGGGYYDAFLATFPGATVGLCRHAQLAESLRAQGAVEPHDVPVQTVISG